MKEEQETIVVYLQGNEPRGCALYRIALKTGTSLLSKLRRKVKSKVNRRRPISVLPQKIFGLKGGWAVIGDDIYWAGTWFSGQDLKITVSDKLLKHNIHHPDPTHWETVTTLNIPRANPVLAAVGSTKLAIVAGRDYRTIDCFVDDSDDEDEDEDEEEDSHHHTVVVDNWANCGEIYDLDHQSLDYLTTDINRFNPYKSYRPTTTEADDQEPTQVVFFNLDEGSMLILDASTGNILEEHDDPSFPFFVSRHPLPLGLGDCESIEPLQFAIINSRAVFHKRTLYWFTYELRLYGYDIDRRRWLPSECLERKLHPLRAMTASKSPLSPLLLGLPNGKFLAIVIQKCGEFTMATLCVRKDVANFTLDVKVEHIQYFHPCDPIFKPTDGKAIRLKNTGSGAMRG